jgi:hypothetical protein
MYSVVVFRVFLESWPGEIEREALLRAQLSRDRLMRSQTGRVVCTSRKPLKALALKAQLNYLNKRSGTVTRQGRMSSN